MTDESTNLGSLNEFIPDINNEDEYLLAVFENTEKVYQSPNIWYYYGILLESPNANNGYHNFRHMSHVTCEMYAAAKYYQSDPETFLVMLLAAIFHDMGHTGESKHPDAINIYIALAYAERDLLPEHKHLLPRITTFIKATQFPHTPLPEGEDSELLMAMRDADMSQSLFIVWQQQILSGMGVEQHKTMKEMLKGQVYFLHAILKFHSKWGVERFEPMRIKRLKHVTFLNDRVLDLELK